MAINKVLQSIVMCLEIHSGVTKAGNPVLKMKFKNGSGKEVAILVNYPKDNLTAAAVVMVMESMIAK